MAHRLITTEQLYALQHLADAGWKLMRPFDHMMGERADTSPEKHSERAEEYFKRLDAFIAALGSGEIAGGRPVEGDLSASRNLRDVVRAIDKENGPALAELATLGDALADQGRAE